MSKPNVQYTHDALTKLLPQYRLIRDVLSGEVAVKDAGVRYLPMPRGVGCEKEKSERYVDYKKRAVFYNVARRTLTGLVGHVFSKQPEIQLPKSLDDVAKNADGSGVSLIQQSKQALKYTVAYGRAGLLVDYPDFGRAVTKADLMNSKIRPTISLYAPQEIINWRVASRGAESVLSLVVLAEGYPFLDDGFEVKDARQYRVLRLTDEGVVSELWREQTPKEISTQANDGFYTYSRSLLRNADGSAMSEIPFTFIGSMNNDSFPDEPEFYDLASLNIAHYRNSADYEESCYMTGQPTAVATGITQEWIDDVLKGELDMGSRGGIPLPAGADLKLVSAPANTMIKEAMEAKERQMVSLGAKLVEQRDVQRTAFETSVDSANEGSTLASATDNVSTAYEMALAWCLGFVGGGGNIEFRLNANFDLSRMQSDEQRAVVEAWQKGALTWGEMRAHLRSGGIAMEADDIAKEEISQSSLSSFLDFPSEERAKNKIENEDAKETQQIKRAPISNGQ